MIRHPRRGLTLFELIVAAGALSVLFGMFMPAIRKAQEAAARSQSANNLKQLALAAHNYYSTIGSFPSGVDDNGFSAGAYLLPYVEQQNVFQLTDFKKAMDAKANAQARAVVIKVFLNPRDPVVRVSDDFGATNYLFCAGAKADLADNDGVFYRNSKTQFPQITDGTSNTLMIGETLKGDPGTAKEKDVSRQHVLLKKEALKGLADDAGVKEWDKDTGIVSDRCASWMDGSYLQGTFSATRPINDPRPDVSCGGAGGLAALRSLGDGVNVALCDGSVRYVNKGVKAGVWKALATRSGGEVIPPF